MIMAIGMKIAAHTSITFIPYQIISAYDITVNPANLRASKQPTTTPGIPKDKFTLLFELFILIDFIIFYKCYFTVHNKSYGFN